MKRISFLLLAVFLTGCLGEQVARKPRMALFVGIDVSGSFYNSGLYDDAIDFLSRYLHGHLNQKGELKPLKNLFVGSIGGQRGDEPKSFRPIHDFEGKSIEALQASLKEWFPKSDFLTDFNVFFKQVAAISKKRNLALSPITILLLSDGIPDFPGKKGDTFRNIDLKGLEYLSRRVTVRLLYASPVISDKWETTIPRRRVRMWTVDRDVMAGWKNQLVEGEDQEKFWTWIQDNVNYRVRRASPIK